MPSLQDIEPQALALTQRERADLASRLLSSLPAVLDDEDDGVAEALRREAQAETDPAMDISLEEFKNGVAALRGK